MNVVLTVDVESYTGDYEREVFAEGDGLAFIVDVCRRHDIAATFFVESLGATRWGREPLKRICALLAEAGQDVQLHLHPVVARIDGFEDHDDVLCLRDRATQERLLSIGLAELTACGARNVTAFRAGDLAANSDTLQAMRAVGLRLSANRDLDQKSSIRSRLNRVFPVSNDFSRVDGVFDVPVSVLRSAWPRVDGPYRHLEISAMGLREMCDGLKRMADAGYAGAGILTHPGEFFRYRNRRRSRIAKNRKRLEGLVEFVSGHPALRFVPVCDIDPDGPVPETSPPEIRAHAAHALRRIGEQGIDRLRARWGA